MLEKLPTWITRPRWPLALVLAALLASLAVLQYRWTGEVARLERDRLEQSVRAAAQAFARDLDLEVSRLALTFFVAAPERLDQAWERWQDEAHEPGLLAEILFFEPPGETLWRFDPRQGALRPAPAADSESLRATLRAHLPRGEHGPRPPAPGVPFAVLADELAITARIAPRPTRRPLAGRLDADRGTSAARGVLVLRLDRAVLFDLLSELAERHFAESGLPYDLVIRSGDEEVWSSSENAELLRRAEPLADLLQVRFFPELRTLLRGAFPERAAMRDSRAARRWRGRRGSQPGSPARGLAPPGQGEPALGPPGVWTLAAVHRAGSLDRAVALLRWRNLGLSSSILLVLAASTGLLLLATRRAQETARRQVEWVAGLTHELHTPLASISAAGENLADGVVEEPARVREYGRLVQREGRRLQALVGQSLTLAGLEADAALELEPIDVREVLEAIVAERRPELTERAFELELAIAEPHLIARANREALGRVLAAVLDNAIKYGERRIEIGCRAHSGWIEVTIWNDGPGLSARDREHLFDPFYRGDLARERVTPGSGLGLHLARRLMRAMGGDARLATQHRDTAPRHGVTVELRLPLASEEQPP